MVSINDKYILNVKVKDNGEKLVNVLDIPKIYLPSQTNIKEEKRKNMNDTKTPYLREGVKKKLKKAINNLPNGYSILLREAYRDYVVQMEWFLKTYIQLHDKNTELNKEELYSETVKYATDPDVYSPHVTGGAIDLALLDKNKRMLDVGQWLEEPESAHFDYDDLNKEQRENRDLLKRVMEDQGFVNYVYEWWHYSYGDKYWGYVKNRTAIYDTVERSC
jgi:D-alanyl-D-alanine dipeptidase